MLKIFVGFLLMAPAIAGWEEIRSPHFTVLTDDGANGRKVAHYFEQMRAAFESAYPGLRCDPNRDFLIFALEDPKGLRTFLDEIGVSNSSDIAGIFLSHKFRHYMVIDVKSLKENREMIFHEYTHMVMSSNFRLPLWLSEGLACFYEQTEFEKESVHIGKADDLAAILREDAWIPLAQLSMVDRKSPLFNQHHPDNKFFAQSWLLTHYMLMSPEGREKGLLQQLLKLSNQGVPALDAMVEVFDDLEHLETQLKKYVREGRFPFATFPVKLKIQSGDYPSTALSPTQVLSYKESIRVCHQAIDLQVVGQLKAHEHEPGVATNLAIVYAWAEDFAAAAEVVKRNAAALESDWLAQYLLSLEPKAPSSKRRQQLELAHSLKPSFAQAAYDLAYMLKVDEPKTAMTYVQLAIQADPPNSTYRNLHAALKSSLENPIAKPSSGQKQAQQPRFTLVPEADSPSGSPGFRLVGQYQRALLYETPLLKEIWAKADRQNIAALLISGKEERSIYGESALHLAAELGDLELTSQLLSAGHDLNSQDAGLWSPLLVALAEDHAPLAQRLLKAGAAVDTINSQGQTSLMWACFYGRVDLVKGLLAKGVNRHALDKNGHNAYDYLGLENKNGLHRLLREFKLGPSKRGALIEVERRELIRARPLDMRRVYAKKAGKEDMFIPRDQLLTDKPFLSANRELNDLYRMASDATLDGEYEKALRMLAKIIALDPAYEPAHDLRVHVLCSMERPLEAFAAMDSYDKIASSGKTLGDRYFQVAQNMMRGILTAEVGRNVVFCLERAWKLTADPVTKYYLGDYFLRVGDNHQALAAYKAYLATSDTSGWREIAEDKASSLERELAVNSP